MSRALGITSKKDYNIIGGMLFENKIFKQQFCALRHSLSFCETKTKCEKNHTKLSERNAQKCN